MDYFSGKRSGKVVKCSKWAVPSGFEPLQWEKIRKVVKCTKLAILSDFRPRQWEKIGKVANMQN